MQQYRCNDDEYAPVIFFAFGPGSSPLGDFEFIDQLSGPTNAWESMKVSKPFGSSITFVLSSGLSK